MTVEELTLGIVVTAIVVGAVLFVIWWLTRKGGSEEMQKSIDTGQERAQPRVQLVGSARKLDIAPPPLYLNNGQVIRRKEPLLLRRSVTPLWFDKGWRENGDGYYSGSYSTVDGAKQWRGEVRRVHKGKYEAYIWKPPLKAIKRNVPEHRPCFWEDGGNGRYFVHFKRGGLPEAATLDQAIVAVEEVLTDAVNGN